MTKLTIGRMAKLYGLHRSTLYEAVAKGRVNAGHDGKGQRVIDLSEMIRVYYEPPGRPTPSPDTSTPAADGRPTPAETPAGWAEMVIELRLLREEVAGLRQELRLIEHKPGGVVPGNDTQPPMGDRSAPVVETSTTPLGVDPQIEGEPTRPQSFADLLAGMK